MENDVTVMSFRKADGMPLVVNLGGVSSDRWVLRPHPTDPDRRFWEPVVP